MANYAEINGGIVENIFVCDDDKTAQSLFPEKTVIVINSLEVGIGWLYKDGQFTAPPEQEKSHEELAAEADAEKQSRLDYAANKIVIWQTKLLMGRKLTSDETTALNDWMDYIDAVTAIDTSTAPDITWPNQPEM